jgi:hypothetical protein
MNKYYYALITATMISVHVVQTTQEKNLVIGRRIPSRDSFYIMPQSNRCYTPEEIAVLKMGGRCFVKILEDRPSCGTCKIEISKGLVRVVSKNDLAPVVKSVIKFK